MHSHLHRLFSRTLISFSDLHINHWIFCKHLKQVGEPAPAPLKDRSWLQCMRSRMFNVNHNSSLDSLLFKWMCGWCRGTCFNFFFFFLSVADGAWILFGAGTAVQSNCQRLSRSTIMKKKRDLELLDQPIHFTDEQTETSHINWFPLSH